MKYFFLIFIGAIYSFSNAQTSYNTSTNIALMQAVEKIPVPESTDANVQSWVEKIKKKFEVFIISEQYDQASDVSDTINEYIVQMQNEAINGTLDFQDSDELIAFAKTINATLDATMKKDDISDSNEQTTSSMDEKSLIFEELHPNKAELYENLSMIEMPFFGNADLTHLSKRFGDIILSYINQNSGISQVANEIRKELKNFNTISNSHSTNTTDLEQAQDYMINIAMVAGIDLRHMF